MLRDKKRRHKTINESRRRLCDQRIALNLTPPQVWRMIKAGNYDLSESTVYRFFDEDDDINPSQHTIDTIASVLSGTQRDGFDASKAHEYYQQSVEMKLSIENLQQELSGVKTQCEALAARLKTYEESISFYRSQLSAITAQNQKLLCLIETKL